MVNDAASFDNVSLYHLINQRKLAIGILKSTAWGTIKLWGSRTSFIDDAFNFKKPSMKIDFFFFSL